jgi:hypothetical protein
MDAKSPGKVTQRTNRLDNETAQQVRRQSARAHVEIAELRQNTLSNTCFRARLTISPPRRDEIVFKPASPGIFPAAAA